jgi:hypothetical protein
VPGSFSPCCLNNQITNNKITGLYRSSGSGIWLWGSYNSFINNSVNDFAFNIVIFEGGDPGTSSVGNTVSRNYWGDYNGTDSNGDGVGDAPYIISANHKDNYPLMAPIDNLAPCIEILSPENETYMESSITLNFTVNESAHLAYSLDGEENVTITGNMTLTGLANGNHNLIVYAKDETGNTGASETVFFNVNVPEPFPVVLVTAVFVAAVAVAGAGLLLYFRRRKKTT